MAFWRFHPYSEISPLFCLIKSFFIENVQKRGIKAIDFGSLVGDVIPLRVTCLCFRRLRFFFFSADSSAKLFNSKIFFELATWGWQSHKKYDWPRRPNKSHRTITGQNQFKPNSSPANSKKVIFWAKNKEKLLSRKKIMVCFDPLPGDFYFSISQVSDCKLKWVV